MRAHTASTRSRAPGRLAVQGRRLRTIRHSCFANKGNGNAQADRHQRIDARRVGVRQCTLCEQPLVIGVRACSLASDPDEHRRLAQTSRRERRARIRRLERLLRPRRRSTRSRRSRWCVKKHVDVCAAACIAGRECFLPSLLEENRGPCLRRARERADALCMCDGKQHGRGGRGGTTRSLDALLEKSYIRTTTS